jgi:polysaccharide export outer membrane protein
MMKKMRNIMRYILGVSLIVAVAACDGVDIGAEENAQYTVTVHPVTAELVSRLNTTRSPRPIEAPAPLYLDDRQYKVGPGDVLFVKLGALSARAEGGDDGVMFLTGITAMPARQIGQEVSRDGTIDVPIIGRVYAQGKTVQQLTDEVTERIKALYKHPSVEVKILEYNAHFASVTGEVAGPRRMPLTNQPIRVLDLVQLAGGPTENADLRGAYLRKENGQTVPIDLLALLLEGDHRFNLLLDSGDSLTVPASDLNKLFVFGEAINPSTQRLRQDGTTLAEALNDMDINDITSNKMAYVIRGATHDDALDSLLANPDNTEAYLSKLSHIDIYEMNLEHLPSYVLADRFQMQPRDVVYLTASKVALWSRFISQLLPGSVTNAVASGSTARTATQ